MIASTLAVAIIFGAFAPNERADRVLEVLDLIRGQVVADVGCGRRWLSKTCAEAVEPDGTVFALETSEWQLTVVHPLDIPNTVPVLSQKNDVSLPEGSVGVASLHDLATDVEEGVRPGS